MNATAVSLGNGDIGNLILRALVSKLVDKGLLSSDDVRALLFEAATHLDTVIGDNLTPEAAHSLVEDDLLPAFLHH